jgi:hypothetical protein
MVIPTPALSEILIKTGKAKSHILDQLMRNPRFVVAPFDLRAAIELSLMTDSGLTKSD